MNSESLTFYKCRKDINITVYHLSDDILQYKNGNAATGLDAEHFYNTNSCMKSIVLWDPWNPIALNSQSISVPIIIDYEDCPTTNLCFKVIKNPALEFKTSYIEDAIIIMISAKSLFRIAKNDEMGWLDYFYGLIGYQKILPIELNIEKLSSLYNHARTINGYKLQNDVWIVVTDLEDFNDGINHDLWQNHCHQLHSCRVVFFHPYGCYKSMSMMMKTIVARNLGG